MSPDPSGLPPPVPTNLADAASRTLFGGRYRLRGLLGVGGSAAVYEAEDTGHLAADGRPTRVAVKVLHPHLCDTDHARAAFLREAQRAGQLRHPNIVAVRGSGLHDAGGMTMAWIALDLAAGPTLAEWVEATGRLSPAAAGTVMDGLLAGLTVAHEAGLVHRDVSPRNIILEGALVGGGQTLDAAMVRILDFGLSDLSGRTTVGGDVLLSDQEHTGPEGVVGNPDYISPEQASGRPVTTAGDLYQAGAVLFFMLTGQAPYLRPRRQQVVEAHLNAPPPVPSALAPAARSLDRVVTRAMAKEPSDRYLDAAEFRTAVGEALSRAGTSRGVLSPGVTGQAGHSPTRVMPTPGRPELPGSARARLHGVPARSTADLDYLAPAAAVSAPSDVVLPPPSRNPAATIAIAAVVAVALLAVLSTFAAPSAARPSPTGLPSTPSPSASPTPSRSSAPAVVSVPTLHGTLAAAERALRASGLTLGQVVRSESSERAGSVLGQSPDPGRQVARGSAVNLEIASGANAVPPTAGLTAAAAVATLESAGFVAVTSRLADDWSAPVIGTEPAAGTVLRLGVTVTVILDGAPAPTPGPTPSPSGTATASTPP